MRLLLTCLLLACAPFPAIAQAAAEPSPEPVQPIITDDGVLELETMVVSGVQPGPGMWKVSKGDNVMWVIGTLTPLPRGMTWLARDVEAVIAQAQEVIQSPGVTAGSDIGMVRGALLIPSLLKARQNPGGETLAQVLPPELYSRWQALKPTYLGRDQGVEKWRPIFAARELYEAAMKKAGLTESGVVGPVVRKAAKQHGVKSTPSAVKIKIDKPKQAIKEFASSSLGDQECFAKTLGRIETDLPTMTARANAWATGDIEALRALPYDDQNRACIDAVLETSIAKKRGMDGLAQRIEAAWLETAEGALARNQVTFATLPISLLLKRDGYLAKLRAKGYVVEEP